MYMCTHHAHSPQGDTGAGRQMSWLIAAKENKYVILGDEVRCQSTGRWQLQGWETDRSSSVCVLKDC